VAQTTISHYSIIKKLGAGGMGEVYLAQDTRLDRKVALKLLLAEFVSNEDRLRRFVQEAKAAAALSHPNIAHIYEIGEADGIHYIAMEFVDGDTLSGKIQDHRCPLGTLLRYLSQVVEGLAKAHAVGIVHRDLKPDNIMITGDGYAKILDFGIAKLVGTKGALTTGEDLTERATALIPAQPLSTAGTVIGTVGYMSPEQAQGKPVDQRSDIFSFGCILYEAATRRRPFEGDSVIDTLHKIIYSPAPPITDLNPTAPSDLQRIVRRCLAKDPEKRYQTIRDVANDVEDLRRDIESHPGAEYSVAPKGISTSGAGTSETASRQPEAKSIDVQAHSTSSAEYLVSEIKRHKFAALLVLLIVTIAAVGVSFYLHARNTEVAIESIAVLPFVNQNNDPDMDYSSDGLTEGIINSLTHVPNLKVIARSSVFRYKGKETDPLTAGKELGVRAVLTGRLAQRGNDLLISAELVDVRDNKQLWGEQYSRRVSDLLTVQREIANEITNGLKLKLSGEQQTRVTKHYTDNPEAYQLYLRGRFYWNKRTGEALKKSIEYFNQAVEKDPSYALAYAGLADAYGLLPSYSAGSPEESFPKAKAAAKKAIELDDSLAEAHTSLANAIFIYDWNLSEAIREFQRAIELNPNYPTAHHWYSDGPLLVMGRFDDAIAEMKRAQELDPLSLIINAEIGVNYYFAGEYDRSIEQLRKTLEMDPNFYFAHYNLGIAYELKGDFREALLECETARRLGDDPSVLCLTGHVLALSGKRDEALKTLDEMKEISKQRYVSAYLFARVYAALGDKDQAFQWLEKSYQDHAVDLCLFKIDPQMANLRTDPRFADLVHRIGL
jgi:serine/threonine protein kinase/tetratricopeptide (TPR) repeat protein